jgi:outer membrane immunogenic protein
MTALNLCRTLCLASVLASAVTNIAAAGDGPFQRPIYAPGPAQNWTGIYLGLGGGTGWGNNAYTWNQDATLAAVAAQMPNPGTLPQLGPTQGSLPISGGLFGGQIGGNWQVERAVFGIQADAHWADIEGHGSCFDAGAVATAGLSFACNDKVSSFGTVTGRVGAAVDHALIYAKGGWAWEFGQHTLSPTAPFNVGGGNNNNNNNNNNNSAESITANSSSQFRNGWTFGAGVEYAVTQNWSAFVEYSYVDLGTNSANSTHLLSQPNNVPASFVIPIVASSTERFNIVKAGLNYRFNWWGGL